jgi:hypothetical protein
VNTNINHHPISWNEELGAYVYDAQGYSGPSTKKIGRIASDTSIQHFIARQLELIAQSLSSQEVANDDLKKQMSNRVSNIPMPIVHHINI